MENYIKILNQKYSTQKYQPDTVQNQLIFSIVKRLNISDFFKLQLYLKKCPECYFFISVFCNPPSVLILGHGRQTKYKIIRILKMLLSAIFRFYSLAGRYTCSYDLQYQLGDVSLLGIPVYIVYSTGQQMCLCQVYLSI